MALNSLLPLKLPDGNNKPSLIIFIRLDGKHTVFGEVIEGQPLLKQLELIGSSNGTPKSKIVIEDCGEVKKETEAAK